MTDKEKLKKIKSFCRELIDEHSSSYDDDDYDGDDVCGKCGNGNEFFSWTDFDKIINIIDGEKK